MMRNQKEAVLLGLAGFALTSLVMLPPIVSEQAAKAARIASYEAAAGADAVPFGAERQARLARLLRNMDEAGGQSEPTRK
ncbi:hypothetical protein ACLBKU_12785 [Erythrobacter sp. NE805]|uniref:hypothetical protein n=1 Tax=Erythrobacter sp. NE805 TaxID=3389875 RepID=UPI00396B40D7